MAIKSIIDIEINDGAFKKFADDFKAYQSLLKEAGGDAAKMTAAIAGADASYEKMVRSGGRVTASVRSFSSELRTVSAQSEKQTHETERQAKMWGQLARDTKTFAGNIASATTSLLKWASIGGIISGLLGAGGLFGIDRLATSAGNARRTALGRGLTPGENSAFGLNYGRVVNPDQFLGGVNEALHDVTKRGALYLGGLSERDIAGKDTGQVASLLIPALKRLADQTPEQQLGNVFTARHLDQFLTLEDFQRLRNTPAGEIAGYGRQYEADRRALELTKAQQKAWQDLQVQLARAGAEIERVLITGLSGLTEPIGRLSKTFTDAIADFASSGTAKKWVDDLADAIKWLDETLKSDTFRSDVKTFIDDIGALAEFIGKAVHKIASFLGATAPGDDPAEAKPGDDPAEAKPDDDPAETAPGQPGLGYTPGKGWHHTPLTPPGYRQGQEGSPELGGRTAPIPPQQWPVIPPGGSGLFMPINYRPGWGGAQDTYSGSRAQSGDRVTEAHDFFRTAGWTEAQAAGLLANIGAESGFRPGAFNPAGGGQGAQGIGQWRGDRIANFHRLFGHDPKDGTFEEQLMFVQWELTKTEAAAGARLRGARTAAEAGAVVNDTYERSGVSGAGRGAAAGQYMQQFKDRSVTVKIENLTGGNVNVSAAALAI